MILKASTRGDAAALGRYLLDSGKNEHVEVHSVEGFLSDDVMGAMRETDALSSAVKSRKYLFSVSLSPPPTEQVKTSVFDDAIRQIKERVGMAEQPHIAVFHENEGRRHLHLVVSRIDPETLTVKELPFYKQRMRDVSKGIFVEQGWEMPRGFVDKADRDPRNFNLAEYQQAKRMGRDMGHLKSLAQDAWAISDTPKAFEQALEARGLYLARGDQRGHVVMSWQGEVFSLPRMLSRKTKEVRERLGPSDDLRGVEETRQHVHSTVESMLRRLTVEAEDEKAREMRPLETRCEELTRAHQAERERLNVAILQRQEQERQARAEQLRTGLRGLWDRLRGERKRKERQNDLDALRSLHRDREQRDALVIAQLRERQTLQENIAAARKRHEQRLDALHRELSNGPEPQVQHEPKVQASPKRQQETPRMSQATNPPPDLGREFRDANDGQAEQRKNTRRQQRREEYEQRRQARRERDRDRSSRRPDFGYES